MDVCNSNKTSMPAVTFYNVAELAAQARRRKQFEQEALQYCSNSNNMKQLPTEDELAAAVGLLMLHYQLSQTTHAPTTPTMPPETPTMTPGRSTQLETVGAERPVRLTRIQTPQSQQLRAAGSASAIVKCEQRYQRLRTHSLTTKLKPTPMHATQQHSNKSSLLTSCRNILKEFLSQNGVQ